MTALLFFLLFDSAWAGGVFDCQPLMTSGQAQNQDRTEDFIALIEDLTQRRVLLVSHLERLRQSIENGQISNPILETESLTNSTALIFYQAIKRFLEIANVDQSKILEWVNSTLMQMDQNRELKEVVRSKSQRATLEMKFNPVVGKAFEMGWKTLTRFGLGEWVIKRTPVKLTHTYELMATHVTQSMWAEVMGSVPELAPYIKDREKMEFNGQVIELQPNHPVYNVTWLSAVEYANRLSVLHGLKPAYDLNDLTFEPHTSAEQGNLRAKRGRVRVNAPNGDIYQTEGYRLPTEAEYSFVLQMGGPPDRSYPFGNDEKELVNYEWYGANSGFTFHPVADLHPYEFNGHNFYDLLGNGSIWMHDFYSGSVQGGINPQGPASGKNHVLKGHYFNAAPIENYFRDNDRTFYAGLRLARTVKTVDDVQANRIKRILDWIFKKDRSYLRHQNQS